ncbi:hypothetical protein M6D93_10715 [Jatrophihabitans telluris]|uniref:Uncharacterized protein n=1 Tax=Jatrophihabitans telluris TaxID=2038343 RepID=A0ABY4QSK7_9ACTN|nr:hypothetical protein [Jatrophihabitans telluris]UQX86779.1 hypothetical protein M6D93_10715 [Jatrophihabitans telluris]
MARPPEDELVGTSTTLLERALLDSAIEEELVGLGGLTAVDPDEVVVLSLGDNEIVTVSLGDPDVGVSVGLEGGTDVVAVDVSDGGAEVVSVGGADVVAVVSVGGAEVVAVVSVGGADVVMVEVSDGGTDVE